MNVIVCLSIYTGRLASWGNATLCRLVGHFWMKEVAFPMETTSPSAGSVTSPTSQKENYSCPHFQNKTTYTLPLGSFASWWGEKHQIAVRYFKVNRPKVLQWNPFWSKALSRPSAIASLRREESEVFLLSITPFGLARLACRVGQSRIRTFLHTASCRAFCHGFVGLERAPMSGWVSARGGE